MCESILPPDPGRDLEGDEAQAWLDQARRALEVARVIYESCGQGGAEQIAKLTAQFDDIQKRLDLAKTARQMLQAPNN